jgi:hypothetical protein
VTATPLASTSAKYSPPAASLKFVCGSAGVDREGLLEAKTIRRSPAGKVVPAGNTHFCRFAVLSVRK